MHCIETQNYRGVPILGSPRFEVPLNTCIVYNNYAGHCYSISYLLIQTGQLSAEQRLQARQILESVQILERQRQQLEFQGQQVQLSLQQAQDAHAMEKQFQEAMQIQQQGSAVMEGRVHPMKLALRKRCVCVCEGGRLVWVV